MRFDLNKLLEFAKEQGVSFIATYSESSDELEVEIISAAERERISMKRVPSVDYLIEKWKERIR